MVKLRCLDHVQCKTELKRSVLIHFWFVPVVTFSILNYVICARESCNYAVVASTQNMAKNILTLCIVDNLQWIFMQEKEAMQKHTQQTGV